MTLFPETEVLRYQGSLPIEIHLPKDTTLPRDNIDHILRIASWDGDINETLAQLEGFHEGNRAVVIPRTTPWVSGRASFDGLQISGIGYLVTEMTRPDIGATTIDPGTRFKKPNLNNYMACLPAHMMQTERAIGTTTTHDRATYAPTGTMTTASLHEKVQKTTQAASLGLKQLLIPHVEAYGYYPSLQHEGKPVGFIVYATPFEGRFSDAMFSTLRAVAQATRDTESVIYHFRQLMHHWLPKLAQGLHELHDKGYCHRQPHASNFYAVGKEDIVLADWSTMLPDSTPEETHLQRSIDVGLVHNQFDKIAAMATKGGTLATLHDVSGLALMDICYAYSNHDPAFFNYFKKTFTDKKDDFQFITSWVAHVQKQPYAGPKTCSLEEGISRVMEEKTQATGRNDPCPCGSGKKAKKCCGTT
jgi:hypothetical protein